MNRADGFSEALKMEVSLIQEIDAEQRSVWKYQPIRVT